MQLPIEGRPLTNQIKTLARSIKNQNRAIAET